MTWSQRAAKGMEGQHNLHQDGCCCRCLRSLIEQGEYVALVVATDWNPHRGRRQVLVLQDAAGQEQGAKKLDCCNPLLWVSLLEGPWELRLGEFEVEPMDLVFQRSRVIGDPTTNECFALIRCARITAAPPGRFRQVWGKLSLRLGEELLQKDCQ